MRLRQLCIPLAAALLALATGNANAVDVGPYAGIKVGDVNIDRSGFDKTEGIGVIVGYGLPGLGVAIEGEYTTTLSTGRVSSDGERGRYDASTWGIFGAYRAGDFVYLKGKLGLVRQDLSVRRVDRRDGTDTTVGYGVGLGIRLPVTLELEYSGTREDQRMLSIAALMRF